MKKHIRIQFVSCVMLFAIPIVASSVEITSFSPNGELTWSNSVIRGLYDIESTSSLTSEVWESEAGFSQIPASNDIMSVGLPLSESQQFFRVIWTNSLVAFGSVNYGDSALTNRVVELRSSSFLFLDSTISDSQGNYFFSELEAGTYKLISPTTENWVGVATTIFVSTNNVLKDVSVYTPVSLSTPANQSSVQNVLPSFEWAPLNEASYYRFNLYETEGNTLVKTQNNISETMYQLSDDLINGTEYRWWISAYDGIGQQIGLTPIPYKFTINIP